MDQLCTVRILDYCDGPQVIYTKRGAPQPGIDVEIQEEYNLGIAIEHPDYRYLFVRISWWLLDDLLKGRIDLLTAILNSASLLGCRLGNVGSYYTEPGKELDSYRVLTTTPFNPLPIPQKYLPKEGFFLKIKRKDNREESQNG